MSEPYFRMQEAHHMAQSLTFFKQPLWTFLMKWTDVLGYFLKITERFSKIETGI